MKLLEEWFIRHFIHSQTRAFPINEAFLATLSQGSRREVAERLSRVEAIGRVDALKSLRVAWTADRTLPRAIVEDRETPPERCVDSLALDFILSAGQRPNVMLRGSAVADAYLLGGVDVAPVHRLPRRVDPYGCAEGSPYS